jgi:hypothetical protein
MIFLQKSPLQFSLGGPSSGIPRVRNANASQYTRPSAVLPSRRERATELGYASAGLTAACGACAVQASKAASMIESFTAWAS